MEQDNHDVKIDSEQQYDSNSNSQTYANLGTILNNQQVIIISNRFQLWFNYYFFVKFVYGQSMTNGYAHGQIVSLADGQQAIIVQSPDQPGTHQGIIFSTMSAQNLILRLKMIIKVIPISAGMIQGQGQSMCANNGNIMMMMPPTNTQKNNTQSFSDISSLVNNVPSESFTESYETGGEEEPLYVNAKQYNRIMKRRVARAKLENDGRIPRIRKV